jgi:mannosyltransferase OCH1-like enzyme
MSNVSVIYALVLFSICIVFITFINNKIEEPFKDKLEIKIKKYLKTKEIGSEEINGVPLDVYMSWGSYNFPSGMKKTIEKNTKMNPEFNFYIYDDKACRDFIIANLDPEVVDAFDTLIPGAYKSDLWRYCVLYKKGGVYMDIKMECKLPLVKLINANPITLVQDIPHYTITNGIWNGFMIYPPGNPIFMSCINSIVNNCKTLDYRRSSLDITGPHLLGSILRTDYPEQEKYITLMLDGHSGKIIAISDRKLILETYGTYRSEQKLFAGKPHYSEYYYNKNVFKLGEINTVFN